MNNVLGDDWDNTYIEIWMRVICYFILIVTQHIKYVWHSYNSSNNIFLGKFFATCSLNFNFTFLSSLSGPCPPTDVHVSLQCVGNVGHVTWAAAPLADLYVATVLPSAGDQQKHNCTSNGTSCSLTNLSCGQTAAVTVVTSERGCTSEPSPPFTFQTGQRIYADMRC